MADTATATDSIGLDYRINLAQLADSIKGAKSQLDKFHKELASLSKSASVTITIHDKAAKAQVAQFKNAIQATLNKAGELEIKEVTQPFGKTSGAVPRMTKDFNNLFTAMGRDEKRLGELNKAFNTVNRSIEKQSLAMTARGQKGGGEFYRTANREVMTLNHLKGTLVATSTGFRNVAAETQRAEAAKAKAVANRAYESKLKAETIAAKQLAAAQAKTAKAATVVSPISELKKMGITSATTTEQFHKMNFAVADHAKIAQLTRVQIKELQSSMASTGKATEEQAHQFNRLGKRLEHSEYQVRKQSSAMGDARRAQERWGAGFKYMMLSQMAWIASGAIIFGAIQGIAQALRDFLDFNQGLVDAAAITQATASGYEKMEAAAMSAFKNSTMGAKEATDALKILGQSGMDAADAAVALETVYKITTATGGDVTTVVKFLTTALNVWKLSAEDAAKVGNVLGAALNYSKLEVEDLGVSFNYVASMAKTIGMSIEELAATMAVMSNAGIKASTIGTGLRGVFSKLISSSPKLEKELDKVELKFSDVSLTSHTLFESLETLSKAGYDLRNVFTGMTRREAASLNVMLEQGVERFNLMAQALKDTTAVEVMFERSMMGMKNQLTLTGHQIQAVFLEGLKGSQTIIIGVAKAIQALVAAIRDLAPVLIGVEVSFAAIKIGMMLTAAASIKLAAGFTAATVATGFLDKALLMLDKHPIILGLTLLIGAFTAGKLIIDKFTKSAEESTSELNREIDALRKLQIILMDSNRTDKEKLEIMADYAKTFKFLQPLLINQKISLEDTVKLISTENKARENSKIAIEEQTLAIKEQQLARAEALKTQDHWLMNFALVTGPSEPYLKNLKEEIALLKDRIAIMKGEKKEKTIDRDMSYELTADMKEALDKLEYEAKDARGKAKADLDKGLNEFGITEKTKTELLTEQAKKRIEIDKKARAEMIEDPSSSALILAERDEKIAALDAQLRAQELLFAAYNKEITKIDEDAESDRQKIKDKALKDIEDRVGKREKAEKNAIKKVSGYNEDYLKLQYDLEKDLIDAEEEGYDKRIKLWDLESKARKKIYADLLKEAEDYYTKLATTVDRSPIIEKEMKRLAALILTIKELQPKLGIIKAKEKPKDPKDIGAGALEGLRKYRKLIEDEYKIWEDMAYEAAMAMQNSFSDLFFDAMMGDLKSLGDYWKSFTTSIKRMIANMASMWLMLSVFNLGGIAASHSGGLIKAHSGGLIKKMHSGGQNLKSDETIRVLKDQEYVIKDSSTRSIGVAALNYANQTGRLPQTQPQQVVNKNYTYIYAMDSESIDLALRKRGAGAISDISLNAGAYARGRRDPRAGRG
jgi:TP901 family phage tail tape measure protein